jgi:hypothetical protein
MKRTQIMLKTVPEVVAAFGGTTATARWVGRGASAVSNWIDRGFIPPGWHYRMSRWASENGYEISPAVFGEDEDDEPPSMKRSPQAVHV